MIPSDWEVISYTVREPATLTNSLLAFVENYCNLPIILCQAVDDN